MFLSNEEYNHIVDLKDNLIQKTPLLEELAQWAKSELNITILDYLCDYTKAGLRRLRLVLWSYEERQKFMDGANYNSKIQERVSTEFSKLSCKYQRHKEYQLASKILVVCDTLKDEIEKRILQQAKEEITSIKLDDIWKIEIIFERVHIFYKTDEQIWRHKMDGISLDIQEKCKGIVEKYDKFKVFSDGVSCVFTSYQTLNEKYAGSMFYYTR